MAKVITTNTLPLISPRTSEQHANLVQTLLSRITIFNGLDARKTTDLEQANHYAEQMRGLMAPMTCDQGISTNAVWDATVDAVMKPVTSMPKRGENNKTLFWNPQIRGSLAPSLSI